MNLFDLFDIFDLIDIAEIIIDIRDMRSKKRSAGKTPAGNVPETECEYDIKKENPSGDKRTEETKNGGPS